jgi:ABC-type nitrate/sulfonate/bicarbonate transport system permease component
VKHSTTMLNPPADIAQAEPPIVPLRHLLLRFGRRLKGLLPIVLFFVLWEIVSRSNNAMEWFNPVFLPAPSVVAHDGWLLGKEGIILDSLLSSTQRIVAGFLIGTAAAIVVAVWMSRFAVVEYWLGPILNLLGPIPALALLPIFIIWLGIGEFPKIILIAWTTFVPMLAYTLDGLKSVQPALIRSALSLGASQRHIFFKVTLPSSLPNVLVGAQVSLGLAFSSLIVSEMMGARSGLGFIIVDARNFFKMSNMFVAIVLIGLEYSVLSFLLKRLERRVVRWRGDGIRSAVEK